MAFADYDEYLASLRLNVIADFQMNAASDSTVGRFHNFARQFVPLPVAPTASVAFDKTSAYSINGSVPNGGAGRLSILGARINPSTTSGVACMLVDILNMSGGMSGTVTTEQTTNLPTAALTRYTTGDGVHAALIVHSAPGSTATTVTATYTNQAGVGSRVTPAFAFGATVFNRLGSVLRLPLQDGDTGVRSVESVTLAASTGGVGNWGVVLYKPLALLMANDVEGANVIDSVSSGRMVGQLNEVLDDACLSVFGTMAALQAVSGTILLGEA
jgi:hypothetical protein